MVLLLYFTMQWCSIYSIFILFVVSLKELQRRQEETSCSRRSFSHAKPLQTPKYTSLIHMQHLPDQDILQRKNVTCVARLLYSYLETFRRIILFIRNFAEKGKKRLGKVTLFMWHLFIVAFLFASSFWTLQNHHHHRPPAVVVTPHPCSFNITRISLILFLTERRMYCNYKRRLNCMLDFFSRNWNEVSQS